MSKRHYTPEQIARTKERERLYREARRIRQREKYNADPATRERHKIKAKVAKAKKRETLKKERGGLSAKEWGTAVALYARLAAAELKAETKAIAWMDEGRHWRNHPEAVRVNGNKSKARQYVARRRDPSYILPKRLRTRLTFFVRGKRSLSIGRLIGCSHAQLVRYIESRWQKGMNWDNYGIGGWHIDHITPCSAFDLLREDHQRLCFHYTNLQPLWQADNIRKGNKIETHQPMLPFLR
jgi:3-methyladenine DNA glycosylase Tag